MVDFRAELSRRCVAAFRNERIDMTLVANKYFGCCDHNKYRAIFDSLPRHARVLEVGCGSGQMIR